MDKKFYYKTFKAEYNNTWTVAIYFGEYDERQWGEFLNDNYEYDQHEDYLMTIVLRTDIVDKWAIANALSKHFTKKAYKGWMQEANLHENEQDYSKFEDHANR